MTEQEMSEAAQIILDNLSKRKGTDQEGKLSLRDIQLLKKIAGYRYTR